MTPSRSMIFFDDVNIDDYNLHKNNDNLHNELVDYHHDDHVVRYICIE